MVQVYLLAVSELRRRMEEIASAGQVSEPERCAGNGGSVRQMAFVGEKPAAALAGWDRLDSWQQEKISRCALPGVRALCMGGQLLLQYGAHRKRNVEDPPGGKEGEQETDGGIIWQRLSYPRLLEDIPGPFALQVAYEPQGKPYIVDVPWHYNLSHSGDYVALAVSDAPVGIDIQQIRPYRRTLVRRFFSEKETAAYERLGAEEEAAFFYSLWCRKEAYGKLKGTGLTEDVLKRNMLEDVDAHLYEYGGLPGYCTCVCSGEK